MVFNGIKILLGVGVLIILYLLARIYITTQRKSLKASGYKNRRSEVGFVVDTFQELIERLKEKEKELERLMAFAEDRAIRLEAYNENILQSVPSGVISIDYSMRIKSINHAAERLLGIMAKDVLDKECIDVFGEPLLSILKNKSEIIRGEYPYITKDNRHIWLGITTSQLKNPANETIGFILVFTDLTDVKALQAQIELKERLSQLGEMSAGIAHELRNPMSVITGYAKLLNKRVEESNRNIVNAIIAEIEGMERIISEFLAFAKPADLNKTLLDLNNIISETIITTIRNNQLVKAHMEAERHFSVMGDEVFLRQAFTNLFTNAVDAMPEGGTLSVELNDLRDKVEIKISDTGCGIPEEIKQKIFLPFYTTKQKGIGLGLSIVHKIIVSHGGNIAVESREGKGSIFTITLPR